MNNLPNIKNNLIQYINDQREFLDAIEEINKSPASNYEERYQTISLINDLIEQNTSHHYVPMESDMIKRLVNIRYIWGFIGYSTQ